MDNISRLNRFNICLTFYTVHEGIKLEKELKKLGVEYIVAPPPRKLYPDCGFALRYKQEDQSRVEKIMKEKSVKVKNTILLTYQG